MNLYNGEIVDKIGRGLNLLVGIANTDTDTENNWVTLIPDEEVI
ncbi:D-aminoacyl-tRNA deacylase [Nostoc sp. ATCC 53789]|nr:D-aminoacyl-tRNA deacylase [Nostoc sp. ATCC 53789]